MIFNKPQKKYPGPAPLRFSRSIGPGNKKNTATMKQSLQDRVDLRRRVSRMNNASGAGDFRQA